MEKKNMSIERNGNIAIVTINRPERMNAFDESLFSKLEKVTEELKLDLPRAVVITGAGDKSFSAGFDVNPDNPMVKRIIEAASKKDPKPARELIESIRRAVNGFVTLPVPIIAALNGSAYGGGAELAMQCDMRIIDPDSVICFSETKLGLMPDWGGCAALARIAGSSLASELILTARKVSADESLRTGIVNRISAKGDVLGEALSIARTIAANGPRAVRHALAVIRESRNLTFRQSLEMESEQAVLLISSGECFHGVGAFLNKQEPVFPEIN